MHVDDMSLKEASAPCLRKIGASLIFMITWQIFHRFEKFFAAAFIDKLQNNRNKSDHLA